MKITYVQLYRIKEIHSIKENVQILVYNVKAFRKEQSLNNLQS